MPSYSISDQNPLLSQKVVGLVQVYTESHGATKIGKNGGALQHRLTSKVGV